MPCGYSGFFSAYSSGTCSSPSLMYFSGCSRSFWLPMFPLPPPSFRGRSLHNLKFTLGLFHSCDRVCGPHQVPLAFALYPCGCIAFSPSIFKVSQLRAGKPLQLWERVEWLLAAFWNFCATDVLYNKWSTALWFLIRLDVCSLFIAIIVCLECCVWIRVHLWK